MITAGIFKANDIRGLIAGDQPEWDLDGARAIGAAFAALLFSLTVVSLPLLLDREVDFVTAMLTSFALVRDNPVVMLSWGALIGAALFLAMIPGFLGLFVVLPLFGHATWHLYRRALS